MLQNIVVRFCALFTHPILASCYSASYINVAPPYTMRRQVSLGLPSRGVHPPKHMTHTPLPASTTFSLSFPPLPLPPPHSPFLPSLIPPPAPLPFLWSILGQRNLVYCSENSGMDGMTSSFVWLKFADWRRQYLRPKANTLLCYSILSLILSACQSGRSFCHKRIRLNWISFSKPSFH